MALPRTRRVMVEGTRYLLRELTDSELAVFTLDALAATQAAIRFKLTELHPVLLAAGFPAIAESLFAHEEAWAARHDLLASMPRDLSPEQRQAWAARHAETIREYDEQLRRHAPSVDAVFAEFVERGPLAERWAAVVAAQASALHRALARSLIAIDGQNVRLTEEQVAALPWPIREALGVAMREMRSPAYAACPTTSPSHL